MFCRQCGSPIGSDSRFCPGCGSPRGSGAPATEVDQPTVAWADAHLRVESQTAMHPTVIATPRPAVRSSAPPAAGPARRVGRFGSRVVWLLLAILSVAALYVVWARVWRSSNPSAPASCESEQALRSSPGQADTVLAFTNATPESVVVYWLNFNGVRERWFEVRPQASRNQRTPSSYRWVVTRLDGTCLQVVTGPGPVVVK